MQFTYPSISGNLDENLKALSDFSQSCADGGELHFVGHSLGGLLVMRMLQSTGNLPSGKLVLLGCPLAGSQVAARMNEWPVTRHLLGNASELMVEGETQMPEDRPVGMLAGSGEFGIGMFIPGIGMGEPGDGTVLVEETCAEGLADHLVLPVSHMGMLFSPDVLQQTAYFLRQGRFDSP